MADKLEIPKFASEGEEARWWYAHRDDLAKAFQDAASRGELGSGSAARLARGRAAGATPITTIRLDPDDISRAQTLGPLLRRLLHRSPPPRR